MSLGASLYMIDRMVQEHFLASVLVVGFVILALLFALLLSKKHFLQNKVFCAKLLVVCVWILIFSTLFIHTMSLMKGVLFATFVCAFFLGLVLIKSVKHDIRQREYVERLKENLEETNTRLVQLDTKKNEFISFAAHQLRSPLTSIRWGLSSLKDEYSREVVEHLEQTTDDLVSTVNDLLDISKIEQNNLVLKKEELDLVDLVGRLVEESRMAAEKKGLKLSFVHNGEACMVIADESKLRQVFVNLIDNAVKYTAEGSIDVLLHKGPTGAVVEIRDTGAGIARDELDDIFGKFLRGAAGKASQSGSGLGLYLAKKIVEAHGGALTVSSAGIGKGSTFQVSLPAT